MTTMTESAAVSTPQMTPQMMSDTTAYQIVEFPEKREPMRRKTSFDATVMERRRFPRVELSAGLPAYLGRFEGAVVNLSARGACVRHTNVLPGTFRLTFQIGNQQVSATAKVVSSRLMSLGRGESADPLFESRLALVEVPHISEYLLARFLARMTANELRGRVANLGACAAVQQ